MDRLPYDFTRDAAEDLREESQEEREARNEENADADGSNELYSLLEAEMISGNETASVAAGLSNLSMDSSSMPYRTGSHLLDQEAVVYKDVYRSLSVMNEASQHNMAATGVAHLDQPSEAQMFVNMPSVTTEPQPRAFGRVPLMHSHLFVRKAWSGLKDMVSTHLKIKEVDVEYTEATCEWRGVVYPCAPKQAMQFVIHANACPELGSDRYLLEFVRLNGCAVAFYELFTELQRLMLDADIVTRSDGDSLAQHARNPVASASTMGRAAGSPLSLSRSSSISSASPRALDYFDDDDDEDDLEPISMSDEELYRPIVEMSSVPFVDVHVQGLALVASEAQKDATRFHKAAPTIVGLLVDRLSASTHAEVQRLCCAALSAFAAAESCVADFISAGAPDALAKVAAVDFSVKGAEAQRQAVAALAALAAHAEARVPILHAVAVFERQFNMLEQCNDRRLVRCIADVRKTLSQVTV
ncbi:Hypothetical Protein FCC1311_084692 [Hondaea fermentalgiana]|uniref:Uncharacterized protein n=1 Tax=Hondaea fermentalgiana TaxID=2315210 RepID=A0A2R5GWC7_9STRA|nr:Hypothetical Protein FCC1311_084692 [Hondaea fermentalgiana]|eukprot:GBG32244.1 Hypothetical Protein FCC1311_084692 [Hondaea fermentalgiana]